jgi:hypothetical protein
MDEALPQGWESVMSRTHGRPFYSHAASGRTSWEKPTPESELAYVQAQAQAQEEASSKDQPAASREAEKESTSTTTVTEQDKKSEETIKVAASTGRAAPLGPASWRSAQNQNQNQSPGPNNARARDQEPDSPWEREAKRSRMVSPAVGNGNGNSRYGRTDPSTRTLNTSLTPGNPSWTRETDSSRCRGFTVAVS